MYAFIDKTGDCLAKFIRPVGWWGAVAAGGILAGMIILTAAAVIARYFFRSPIYGAEEVLSLSLVALIWLVLAEVEIRGRHIRCTVFYSSFPTNIRLLVDFGGTILNMGLMVLIVWQVVLLAIKNLAENNLSLILDVPLGALMLVLAAGAFLAFLSFLSSFVRQLSEILKQSHSVRAWAVVPFLVNLFLFTVTLWFKMLPFDIGRFESGLAGFFLMLILLILGVPIGSAMLLAAYIGVAYVASLMASLNNLAVVVYNTATTYTWVVVPLFVVMGNFLYHAGFGRDIYRTVYAWIGHLPGGLAMATIGGCAGFAAACGESLATAMTMGPVALPEMRRYNYDPKLATGAVAAGGTLGILIPPSLGFIVYGIITEQSIGKLFVAGILPGIMLSFLFMVFIYLRVKMNPKLAAIAPPTPWKQRLISLSGAFPILLLFLLVVGGIYIGLFAPSEGGGIGAFGVLVIGLAMMRFTWRKFADAISDAVVTNCAVFYIFTGALTFGTLVSLSKIPLVLSQALVALPVSEWVVFILVLLFYILLGCVMNILPAMIVTLPIIFPAMQALGFDPIWFGVIMVITMEMGQITPPLGINVFGIASIARDVPMGSIFRGIFPFFIAMLLAVAILAIFPQIATFLPGIMYD